MESGDKPTATQLAGKYAADIQGKVILTTGVSPNSLGSQFVQSLAAHSPGLLILAGRNRTKTQAAADAILADHPDVATRVLELDLGSLDAVRRAAEEVNGWDDVPRIDVLMLNAGIMAAPYGVTGDGIESQLGTNHVGHFLFANLVMGKVLRAEEPRVVVVSSDGHRLSPFRFGDYNFDEGKTYNRWFAYGQSKTANMLMAVSLAKKLGSKGLKAFSLHPGVIFTNLGAHVDWTESGLVDADRLLGNREGWEQPSVVNHDQGAATHVFACFDKDIAEHNGQYLLECRLADAERDTYKVWAYDQLEAERVWEVTEKLAGQEFPYE